METENRQKCKIKSSSKTSTKAYSESRSWYRSHRVMLESQRVNIESLIEKATTERTAAMVSESFMLQNLSVIEHQKAQLDILFRKSIDNSSNRGQCTLAGTETTSCSSLPSVKTVSFCGIVDELHFDREDPWQRDDDDKDEYEFEDDESLDNSTASDCSDEDEEKEVMLRGKDPQTSHAPRWSPDFMGTSRASSLSLSPSLSPVARLVEAAAAKCPGSSPRAVPFGGADAR
jgi:hypothetical protein